MTPELTPLERFRVLLTAEQALADALCAVQEPDAFARRATNMAASLGLSIRPDELVDAIRPDPLGIARWTGSPVAVRHWPSADWLPANVLTLGGECYVDWAHFGGLTLEAPFFEDLIRRAMMRPFNRVVRIRMTLADFVSGAPRETEPAPDGIIFHMSRCGSTLVSRMLAALPRCGVLSEAQPLDAIVGLGRIGAALPAILHAQYLAAMAQAFARGYRRDARHFFIKVDSWHAMALALFRQAFPATPFVFLYRDPVEVLVSHIRQRGSQMVPELVSPALYGLESPPGDMYEDYCARVLQRICGAVVADLDDVGIRLVNYRELPDAVWTAILPHFGVPASEEDISAMLEAARNDAKAPHRPFCDDGAEKQRAATQAVRTAAARHLGEVYDRLESLRLGAGIVRAPLE